MNITVPCETLVRFSLITGEGQFRSIRFDNGLIVASNRMFIAAEKVGDFEGVASIVPTEALIDQCEVETQFSGRVEISINEMLKYATAKTTMGFVINDNIGYFEPTTEMDRWREVVGQAAKPAKESKGFMYVNAGKLQKIAECSPSGGIVFEEFIDADRPAVLRDSRDPNWVGFFRPRALSTEEETQLMPAKYPEWLK